jgi:hypothetical protein
MIQAVESRTIGSELLDEILPAIQRLSVHDKLVLIRILAEELVEQESQVEPIPPGTYEFYTPYEIEGITDEVAAKFESLPLPLNPSNEN